MPGLNFSQIFGVNKGLISLPVRRVIKGLICLVVFSPITFLKNLAVRGVRKRVIEGVIFRPIFRVIGGVIFCPICGVIKTPVSLIKFCVIGAISNASRKKAY